jgi:hypothetical protein
MSPDDVKRGKRKASRGEKSRESEQHNVELAAGGMERQSNMHPVISTGALLGSLSVVLWWEWQAARLLIWHLKQQNRNAAAEVVSWIVTGLLCGLVYWRGKSDFRRFRTTGGRVLVSTSQVFVVTAFMIAFGTLLAWLVNEVAAG